MTSQRNKSIDPIQLVESILPAISFNIGGHPLGSESRTAAASSSAANRTRPSDDSVGDDERSTYRYHSTASMV